MPAPRIAHPIHRLGDTELIEHLAGGCRAFIEGEVAVYWTAAAVSGTLDRHNVPVRAERVYQRTPAARIDPQAVPQHRRRARAGLPDSTDSSSASRRSSRSMCRAAMTSNSLASTGAGARPGTGRLEPRLRRPGTKQLGESGCPEGRRGPPPAGDHARLFLFHQLRRKQVSPRAMSWGTPEVHRPSRRCCDGKGKITGHSARSGGHTARRLPCCHWTIRP